MNIFSIDICETVEAIAIASVNNSLIKVQYFFYYSNAFKLQL